MGSFGTGFLSGLGQAAHERAQRQHALEMEAKQREAQYHWGALQAAIQRGGYFDPNGNFIKYTPQNYQEMVDTTVGNVSKAYGNSKPMKEIWDKTKGMVSSLIHHPNFHEQEDKVAQPGDQSSPAPATATDAQSASAEPQTLTPARASDMEIPAPPGGQQPQPQADPTMLSPRGANESGPQETPAVAARRFPFPAPPTGDAAVDSYTSAPTAATDGGAPAPEPQPVPSQPVVASKPDVPPVMGPANSPAAQALDTPTVAPAPKPQAQGAIPPPPLSSQDMLNSYATPMQEAQLVSQARINAENAQQQAAYNLRMQQAAQTVQTLENQLHRKLTPIETQQIYGIKVPTSFLQPHYQSQIVTSEELPSGATTVDGLTGQDIPGGRLWQRMDYGGQSYYAPVTRPNTIHNIGNLEHAINPYTGQDLGAASQVPVKAGQSSSRVAPMTTIGPDGQIHQYGGSSSTAPNTVASPSVGATGLPVPSRRNDTTVSPNAGPPTRDMHGSPITTPQHLGEHAAAAGKMAKAGASNMSPAAARTFGKGELPVGQLAQQQKRNTSINNAGGALQILSQPQEDGFSDLDVFKDPKSVSRIADYLTINNQSIEGDFNKAQESGITGTLAFMAGLPQAFNSAKNEQVRKAYNSLTPADRRFVADYYSLLGQWGGMRAATGASGSKYNFLNLSQEIPNPMSITDYRSAINKVKDNIKELNRTARPNTLADTYSEESILGKGKSNSSAIIPPQPSSSGLIGVPAGGKIHYFKTQEAADNFQKLLAGAK